MQLHESPRIPRVHPSPSSATVATWARLLRVQHDLLAAVEADLKAGGFPPLAWYDALLELSRAGNGRMRPVELEKAMLLPQYSTSRLTGRLARAGLIAREVCPMDRRGQFIAITAEGRALQKRMWQAYAAAIERHIGSKLSKADAERLCALLAKLS
jgi:DNA-binding MarR family transcriptional regulator